MRDQTREAAFSDPQLITVAVFHPDKRSVSSGVVKALSVGLGRTYEVLFRAPLESNHTLVVFSLTALRNDVGFTAAAVGANPDPDPSTATGTTKAAAAAFDVTLYGSVVRLAAGTLRVGGLGTGTGTGTGTAAGGEDTARLQELAACMAGRAAGGAGAGTGAGADARDGGVAASVGMFSAVGSCVLLPVKQSDLAIGKLIQSARWSVCACARVCVGACVRYPADRRRMAGKSLLTMCVRVCVCMRMCVRACARLAARTRTGRTCGEKLAQSKKTCLTHPLCVCVVGGTRETLAAHDTFGRQLGQGGLLHGLKEPAMCAPPPRVHADTEPGRARVTAQQLEWPHRIAARGRCRFLAFRGEAAPGNQAVGGGAAYPAYLGASARPHVGVAAALAINPAAPGAPGTLPPTAYPGGGGGGGGEHDAAELSEILASFGDGMAPLPSSLQKEIFATVRERGLLSAETLKHLEGSIGVAGASAKQQHQKGAGAGAAVAPGPRPGPQGLQGPPGQGQAELPRRSALLRFADMIESFASPKKARAEPEPSEASMAQIIKFFAFVETEENLLEEGLHVAP